jgi:hypothetical protein
VIGPTGAGPVHDEVAVEPELQHPSISWSAMKLAHVPK